MKGIVADIKGKYVVVMGRDGSFVKVRNNGLYRVGFEIDIAEPSRVNTRLMARVSSMAAGALLVLGVSYGAYSYTAPYSLVDVDINPSIELTTNIYDRIIKTEALNEDGKKLLKTSSLKHSKLDDGITAILNNAIQQGYIKEDTAENAVVFTVVSKDAKRVEKLQKGLEKAAAAELKQEGVKSDLVIDKASQKEHDTARVSGLTPGKLNLIEKAIKAIPELKLEDLKDEPVKDIMEKIKDGKKEENIQNKQNKQQGKQQEKQNKQQDKQQEKQNQQGDKQQEKQNQQQDKQQEKQNQQRDKQVDNNKDKQDGQDKKEDVKKNGDSDISGNISESDSGDINTGSGNTEVNDHGANNETITHEDKGKSDDKNN